MNNWNFSIVMVGERMENQPFPVEEIHYFHSIQQAMVAMLSPSILERFGEYGKATDEDAILNGVVLIDESGKVPPIYLKEIPLAQAIKDSTTAGIYLTCDWPGDINLNKTSNVVEQYTGISLKHFENYQEGENNLRLVSYHYNQLLTKKYDDGFLRFNQTLDSIDPKDQNPLYYVRANYLDIAETQLFIERYYFPSFTQAFSKLISFDLSIFDYNSDEAKNDDRYLLAADIFNVHNKKQIGYFIADPYDEFNNIDTEYIYLQTENTQETIRTLCLPKFMELPLNTFPDGQTLITVGQYSEGHNTIYPLKGFSELRDQLHIPETGEKAGYQIIVTELIKNLNAGAETEKTETFDRPTFQSAFEHLYQLDKDQFLNGEIKQATIIDANGQNIATKFSFTGAPELPPGVYIRIDPMALTSEVSKAMAPYLSPLPEASNAHILICRQKEDKPIEKKHAATYLKTETETGRKKSM
ncbi:hypothetical protein PV783_13745 [Chitinophaga sp. CC14]|uniref:hypothetical protein n=1 Tax=Chitinophaga sp. CC14 TaxID=3029199 RepID=UPI003B7E79A2